ncbi:mechanosensitive ion channel family protein [Chengkuizengella axinellae]|uniref:Mechanosensitive ion channel family protein n=1 Tax=Chengkuizengella axinellae TaxID=3064388 RepID=A0ABT9IYS3_9BACL|nr:mechanosensitive ion channel family protein [Chengkuizengella sp. 2205SS18-9]MDP5274516.1 mechanosensitive ion channel family protein [Chengkuizengella sp. 2205SS18-9]
MFEVSIDSFKDLLSWDSWESQLIELSQRSLMILLIIGLTWLALKVRKAIITRVFDLNISRMQEKQKDTLETLLLSLTKYIIFIISILMILSNAGLDVAPIIAGAGVLGLAVGFGAQTLVKDLITGFFIIFEDQFSVGDYVSINNGEINGTVVDVGLRATKIRTWGQHSVVIQNSEIRTSQNYNRERMRAIINITVPYEVDPSEIEQAINEVSIELVSNQKQLFLLDDKGEVMEAPQLYGITDVENNALGAKYTVISMVRDEHYWTAAKEIRKGLLKQLNKNGIQISYPRRIERQEFDADGFNNV